jgi:hypothetical protein
MAKKKIYFAKVHYNDDIYTYSSFSLIHTVTLITLRFYSVLASDCYLPTASTM